MGLRILERRLFGIRARNLLLFDGGESFLSFNIACLFCK